MMKKLCLALIISALFIQFIDSPVLGLVAESYTDEADLLKDLGLFQGTEKGYQLDTVATRAQGAVMLVRFLGQEDKAKGDYSLGSISHPFEDVPTWADPHVAYLYSNGLTNGMSSRSYGSDGDLTGAQYMTMMLRMLGYDDGAGEFTWDKALDFWNQTYKLESSDYESLSQVSDSSLSRGLMVRISYLTLANNYKKSSVTVFEDLYQREVFGEDKYSSYKELVLKQSIEEEIVSHVKDFDERKGLWLSYLELGPILNNANEHEYRNDLAEIFSNGKSDGFNTIYFQVRSNSDAIYPSEIYSWSYLINDNYAQGPGYDPLSVAVELAHEYDLRLEAWINPYRIRTNAVYHPVESYDKLQALLNDSANVFKVGDLWTLNPASSDVRDHILAGVEELLSYDIDGIQYDDYFYPNQDMTLDADQYEAYIESNGWISQGDFRRNQVTQLIVETYKLIKETKSQVAFGISPQGSFNNNYNNVFLDINEIIYRQAVDYLLPQVYYGFDNQHSPYETVLAQWEGALAGTDIDLLIGLSAYKIGLEDKWAGSGSDEWITDEKILARMLERARALVTYRGVSVFRYDSIYHPAASVEQKVIDEVKALSESF